MLAGSSSAGNEDSDIDAASVPDQRNPRFVEDIEMFPATLSLLDTATLPEKLPSTAFRLPATTTLPLLSIRVFSTPPETNWKVLVDRMYAR